MGAGYRDERDAAFERAEALERENRELRSQLAGPTPQRTTAWRVIRWVAVVVVAFGLLGVAGVIVLTRGQIAPPDIDSPPGVTGTMRLEIAPMPADVSIDEGPPNRLDHFLSVSGLDPNVVHHIRVTAPGYQPEERNVVVPANGTRSIEIELRPIAAH